MYESIRNALRPQPIIFATTPNTRAVHDPETGEADYYVSTDGQLAFTASVDDQAQLHGARRFYDDNGNVKAAELSFHGRTFCNIEMNSDAEQDCRFKASFSLPEISSRPYAETDILQLFIAEKQIVQAEGQSFEEAITTWALQPAPIPPKLPLPLKSSRLPPAFKI